MKTTLTQASRIRYARAFITVLLMLTSIPLSAQVPFWSNNGNNATSNDFLGTTNNQPLIFKTNGLEVMRLNPTGTVKFNSFMNMGNGILWSSNGTLSMTPFPNDSNKVYTGNGTFRSFSSMSGWTLNSNLLYSSPGINVGIGVTNPAYALEVNGSAYFHGTVFATGIVLANKVEVDTLKSADMISINNNLNMKGGSFNEFYATSGDLRIQSNANTSGNTILNAGYAGNVGIGTASPQYKLDIGGDLRVNGKVYVFRILPLPGDSEIHFGDSSIIYNPSINRITATPTYNNNQYIGGFTIGWGYGGYASGSHSLAFGNYVKTSSTASNAIVIGSGYFQTNQFLVNTIPNSLMVGFNSNIPTFFVGPSNGVGTTGKVGISTSSPLSDFQVGQGYVKVCLGSSPGAASNYSTGYIGFNVAKRGTDDWFIENDFSNNGGTVIMGDIFGDLRFINVQTTGASDRSLSDQAIQNNTSMRIRRDGRVIIGTQTQAGGPHDNAFTKLTVDGKIVCRELFVTQNTWADSIFSDDYVLMPFDSLRAYIDSAGHLPYVPSESEVKTNGSNLAANDVILLAKIEELTLYMLLLQEQNLALQKRIEELEKSE